MNIINRNLIQIKAKQPFLDWLNKTPYSIPVTLTEVNQDCTVILVPEFETAAELSAYIDRLKPLWFEIELTNWNADTASWPKVRTAALFEQWFDLTIHSVVWDATDTAPLAEPHVTQYYIPHYTE